VQVDCTSLVVTHSPAEALALGERITVLESGRVSQTGSRDDLMRRPRSAYVAEFLGVNLFRGSLARHGREGAERIALPQGDLVIADASQASPGSDADEVAIVVHPRDITLALARPEGTARNVLEGPIEELVPEPPDGALVRISLATRPPLIA